MCKSNQINNRPDIYCSRGKCADFSTTQALIICFFSYDYQQVYTLFLSP